MNAVRIVISVICHRENHILQYLLLVPCSQTSQIMKIVIFLSLGYVIKAEHLVTIMGIAVHTSTAVLSRQQVEVVR